MGSLNARLRKRVWAAANVRLTEVTLDTDTTVHKLYGDPMGGRVSYNRKNKGKPSYQPMLTFIAETSEYAGGGLHNGDKPTGESIARHLARVIEALPKTVETCRARADSGFYYWDAVKAYTEWKCGFVIVARKTDRLLGELQAAEWRSSSRTDADFEGPFSYQRRVGNGNIVLWACAMTRRNQTRTTRISLDFSMTWLAATACL